jgi:hypothetical protein
MLIAQATLFASVSTFDDPLERRLPLSRREPKALQHRGPGEF